MNAKIATLIAMLDDSIALANEDKAMIDEIIADRAGGRMQTRTALRALGHLSEEGETLVRGIQIMLRTFHDLDPERLEKYMRDKGTQLPQRVQGFYMGLCLVEKFEQEE